MITNKNWEITNKGQLITFDGELRIEAEEQWDELHFSIYDSNNCVIHTGITSLDNIVEDVNVVLSEIQGNIYFKYNNKNVTVEYKDFNVIITYEFINAKFHCKIENWETGEIEEKDFDTLDTAKEFVIEYIIGDESDV